MKTLRLALVVTLIQAMLLAPILYYRDAIAGLITRSTKAGSTTSFATSNSLGNTLAVADLDTDLDNLYSLVNGALDANNLAADSVEASELANNSVAAANVINGTITSADTIVRTIGSATIAPAALPFTLNTTTETTIATATVTTLGGPVVWFGNQNAWANFLDSTSLARLRCKRGATTVSTIDLRPSSGIVPTPVVLPICVDSSGTVATSAYSITIQLETGGFQESVVWPSVTNPGTMWVMELL